MSLCSTQSRSKARDHAGHYSFFSKVILLDTWGDPVGMRPFKVQDRLPRPEKVDCTFVLGKPGTRSYPVHIQSSMCDCTFGFRKPGNWSYPTRLQSDLAHTTGFEYPLRKTPFHSMIQMDVGGLPPIPTGSFWQFIS